MELGAEQVSAHFEVEVQRFVVEKGLVEEILVAVVETMSVECKLAVVFVAAASRLGIGNTQDFE